MPPGTFGLSSWLCMMDRTDPRHSGLGIDNLGGGSDVRYPYWFTHLRSASGHAAMYIQTVYTPYCKCAATLMIYIQSHLICDGFIFPFSEL